MCAVCRLWDGDTGALLRVLATPRDWRDAAAGLVSDLWPAVSEQHVLHLGFEVAGAKGALAVFSGGRHLRICRFIPAPA